MTRLLIVAVVIVVALLAVWHPAPAPPALAAVGPPLRSRPSPAASVRTALVVYVVGAVRRAGLYRLREGSRVDDAVRLAGGLTSTADPAATNLARRLRDGDEIVVARIGETTATRARSAPKQSRTKRKSAAAEVAPVDLNHADAAEIAALPSVGPALAQRIVAFRQFNGPFVSLDDLGDVAGMTQARIDAVSPYVVLR